MKPYGTTRFQHNRRDIGETSVKMRTKAFSPLEAKKMQRGNIPVWSARSHSSLPCEVLGLSCVCRTRLPFARLLARGSRVSSAAQYKALAKGVGEGVLYRPTSPKGQEASDDSSQSDLPPLSLSLTHTYRRRHIHSSCLALCLFSYGLGPDKTKSTYIPMYISLPQALHGVETQPDTHGRRTSSVGRRFRKGPDRDHN